MTTRNDARDAIYQYLIGRAACMRPRTIAAANSYLDRYAAQVRAEALREAADFLRDAHFQDGLTPQEIGTALRFKADRAQPDA
ncbi:hypothetical protein ACWGIB_27590 [Streptomyces xiamenensis]